MPHKDKPHYQPQVLLRPDEAEALHQAMINYRIATGWDITWAEIAREYGAGPFCRKFSINPHSKEKTAVWPDRKRRKRA